MVGDLLDPNMVHCCSPKWYALKRIKNNKETVEKEKKNIDINKTTDIYLIVLVITLLKDFLESLSKIKISFAPWIIPKVKIKP